LTPHLPYSPPPGSLRRLNPHLTRREVKKLNEMVKLKNQGRIAGKEIEDQEVKKLVDLYDAEISYTDYAIGELLSEMESLGALEDTCIAISADHGEEFMEHGGFTHGNKLYEEVVKVPLIISGPDIAPSSRKNLGGLVDLAPTLLDLLELPPEPLFQGRSILKDGRERMLCETHNALACRTRNQKYIWDKRTGKVELYNLATDPDENENLGEGDDSRYFEKAINTYLLKKSTLGTLQRAKEKITPKEPQGE